MKLGYLLFLSLLLAACPRGVLAAAPAWLAPVTVDYGSPAPRESYLKEPHEAKTAPAWFDLSKYPFPTPALKPAVASIPGQAHVAIPGPARKFYWWKVPVYAVIGLPRDGVDLAFGLADKVPVFGGFAFMVYQMVPLNHLFRHPDDRYPVLGDGSSGSVNKNGHGLTYGLLDGWHDPGFFSNLRCTKWVSVSNSPVRRAKEHNKRVDEAIAKANRKIEAENRALQELPKRFLADIEPAFQKERFEEAFTRYKSFRTTCREVARAATPDKMLRLRRIAFESLARLAAKDAPNSAWFRSEMHGLDRDLFQSLPAAFDGENVRARGLVLLALWQGVYGNDFKEAVSVLDEVARHYEKAGRVRERAEVIRWVRLPVLLVAGVRGAAGMEVDTLFPGAAVDVILALPKLAETAPQYSEELRSDTFDVIQGWTFYSVAKSRQELEKNLGFQIIDQLKDHANVAWRQQARELVAELKRDSGKMDVQEAQKRLWGKVVP